MGLCWKSERSVIPMTQNTEIDGAAVDELQASFRGEVIRAVDAGYDEHRKVWNGSIDRRPALIVRCTGVADVRAAIRFARSQNLRVAVREAATASPGCLFAMTECSSISGP
ncbi:6-hydroxy-D-nicotine oxidase [Arthrobacter sp. Hiyo4]|nr:6-hydroxy-D-nicotine oxidase [Arthrobacter sp. Hiyo4]